MNRGCKSAKTFEIESMTYQPMNLDTGKLFRSFWREISHFFLKVTLFTVLCEMKIWQKRKRITDYLFPRQHNRLQMQMALKTWGKSRTGLPPPFYTYYPAQLFPGSAKCFQSSRALNIYCRYSLINNYSRKLFLFETIKLSVRRICRSVIIWLKLPFKIILPISDIENSNFGVGN